MEKYIVVSLVSDGYERFAILQNSDETKEFFVHFLQYDEYVEMEEESKKIKTGDIIKGQLFIDLIMNSEKVDKPLAWGQPQNNTPFIEAVVCISKVIDDYSVYATSLLSESPLLMEFEDKVDYAIGDTVSIEGTLEFILSDFT